MKKLVLSAVAILAVLACSKEDAINSAETQNSKDTQIVIPKDMDPNPDLTNSRLGLYHGIIAAAYGQSRGKVWVNLRNDGRYSAYVELVDGQRFKYELLEDLSAIESNQYYFVSERGRFVIDVTDKERPIARDIVLNDEPYFMRLFKNDRGGGEIFMTGTFFDSAMPSFSGTWNMMSSGSYDSPNGFGGDELFEVFVTHNGNDYYDSEFETFDSSACLGLADVVPVAFAFGPDELEIWADEQVSFISNGVISWDLSFTRSGGFETYLDLATCGGIFAGFFIWTNDANTITRVGEIYVD